MEVCPAGCGIWLDQGELAAVKEYLGRVDREAASPYGKYDVPAIREKMLQWQALHPEEDDDFGAKLKASYKTPCEDLARYVRRHTLHGYGGLA